MQDETCKLGLPTHLSLGHMSSHSADSGYAFLEYPHVQAPSVTHVIVA